MSNASVIGLWRPVPELRRVAIEAVMPEIDGGRFAIKRTVGERVVVGADIHADGHEMLRALVLYRAASQASWLEREMTPLGNDRWEGAFCIGLFEPYVYTASKPGSIPSRRG